MIPDFHYEPMNADKDLPAVGRLLVHAFAGTPEGVQDWLKAAGFEHMRVVRRTPAGPPVACLLRIPMGQFFGGRVVPMVGIAAVATAPETRGQGLARAMMRRCVQEAAHDGFPISVLYPSTQALYRQAGYEQAGNRLLARLPLATIDVRERGGAVGHLSDADDGAVREAYAAFAARFDGMVDRGPYVWNRIKKFREEIYHGFGIRGPGGLDGYLYLNQKRKPEPDARQEITLTDFAFRTPEAGRRLLGFLADFATMGDDVVFAAGPSHPALMLLGQQRYKLGFHYYWMLRILSVEAALTARGYCPGIDAELHLDVEDDAVPQNSGRFTLRVRDGRADVSTGGRGDLRTGIRGLAAMYTGHLSAPALALCGLASGDERALRTAAAVFGGSVPWMTDFF